jgi:hypothetical protein
MFGSDRVRVWHVRHEGVGGNGAETPSFEVFKGLDYLVSSVHDKRSVMCDRLTDRLATEHEDFEVGRTRVLKVVCPDT